MSEINVDRRRILLRIGGALLALRTRLTFMVGGAALTTSAPAHAFPWGTVALSSMSSLSGLIASSQRGDGGISTALNASLGYLRVMADQLTSIQTALIDIMEAISGLDEKFRDSLNEQRAKVLHQAVGAQISNYADEYERYQRGDFSTFSAWQKHDLTKNNLTLIDHDLNSAVNAEEKNRSFGPLTAHQLPAAMFCAMAVRVGLGDSPSSIAVRATQYFRRFDMCSDGSIANSTMAQMNAALAGLRESAALLKGLGVEIPPETSNGVTSFVDRTFAVVCSEWETQPKGDCMADCTSVSYQSRLYRAVGQVMRGVINGTPENEFLVRPLVANEISLQLLKRENTLDSPGKPFPGLPFPGVPIQELESKLTAFGRSCPGDAPTWDNSAFTFLKADKEKFPTIRSTVDVYNKHLGHVALCSTALAGLFVARQAALRSIRSTS